MNKIIIKYSAPEMCRWELGPEGLLCQSQLEEIVPDEGEGIVF